MLRCNQGLYRMAFKSYQYMLWLCFQDVSNTLCWHLLQLLLQAILQMVLTSRHCDANCWYLLVVSTLFFWRLNVLLFPLKPSPQISCVDPGGVTYQCKEVCTHASLSPPPNFRHSIRYCMLTGLYARQCCCPDGPCACSCQCPKQCCSCGKGCSLATCCPSRYTRVPGAKPENV